MLRIPYAEINTIVEKVRKYEKNRVALTEQDVAELYTNIYQFVERSLKQAEDKGKLPLFALGESHITSVAKSSLLVESIFMLVGKKLGIKTAYLEAGSNELSIRRQLADAGKRMKNQQHPDYDQFCNEMDLLVHLLKNDLMQGYELVATEKDMKSTDSAREIEMCSNIVKHNKSGILTTGTLHLKGIANNKELNEKFEVFLVNTQPSELLTITQGVEQQQRKKISKEDQQRYSFVKNPAKVKQFGVQTKIIDAKPGKLIQIANKVHSNFKPKPLQDDVAQTSGNRSDMESPVASYLPSNRNIKQSGQIESGKDLSLQQTLLGNMYETVPVTVLVEAGLWFAGKLGWCGRYVEPVAVSFQDELSQRDYEYQQQKKSAEIKLQRQGTSLSAVKNDLFGKSRSFSDENHRAELEKFLIDVLNGEVFSETGQRFNQIAAMGNKFLRAKEFDKLLQKHQEEQCPYSLSKLNLYM